MSVPELKRELTRLSRRGRLEVHAHLVWLQHNTLAWKREAARRIRDLQAGRAITADDLESRLRFS